MSTTPRRALIVIDVQNEYVTGKLPITYPPVQESLRNVGLAMDAARFAGIPVVVVQHLGPAESPVFARGSHGGDLHEVVTSRPYDHHIEKTQASSFAGTDLAQWLAAREIDTLSVIGYMTHNCDNATIMHASHAGMTVEFLSDATGSLPYSNDAGAASAEEIHRVFSVVFHSSFAAVQTTAQWIEAVQAGQPTERDNIVMSSQRGYALAKAA